MSLESQTCWAELPGSLAEMIVQEGDGTSDGSDGAAKVKVKFLMPCLKRQADLHDADSEVAEPTELTRLAFPKEEFQKAENSTVLGYAASQQAQSADPAASKKTAGPRRAQHLLK